MTENLVYEASVYTRTIGYKNFKGETKSSELYFALDPLQLMQVFVNLQPKKSKSGNPALRNAEAEFTDEQQLKMIRDLAEKAAGTPSEDGESWEPFENFADSLVGKAFLTKLTASDADRQEFADKVILAPFKAFVNYASNDESNSPAEVASLVDILAKMENVFKTNNKAEETLDEKKARIERELAALNETPSE